MIDINTVSVVVTIVERSILAVFIFAELVNRFPSAVRARNFIKRLKGYFKKKD